MDLPILKGLPAAFKAMGEYSQFIVVKFIPDGEKFIKLPCTIAGVTANAHDPVNWLSASSAILAANLLGAGFGVGFVFTENDPFFFLDIDGCVDGDGNYTTLSVNMLTTFTGAAIELSSSGHGLHVFGTGVCPPHKSRNDKLHIEFYTSKRFVALTGTLAGGDASTDYTDILPAFIDQYFKPTQTNPSIPSIWSTEPRPEWSGPEDDAELLPLMLRSRSAASVFSGKANFSDLWTANADVLGESYPSNRHAYNASLADAALAQHLAFWTGNNCERILRLMHQSELVRDKWDRADYLPLTIRNACNNQRSWYSGKKKLQDISSNTQPPQLNVNVPCGTLLPPSGFLSIEQQQKLFEGCTYVQDENRILTPRGTLLNTAQFNNTYGRYVFPLEPTNSKITTEAFKAALQSQLFTIPHAETTGFKPTMTPGALVNHHGRIIVNSYYPLAIPRVSGDITPFISLVCKLWPDERDRTIALSYMAALVQYPGEKFKWCIFIQGVPGNGKSLLISILINIIGQTYCHIARGADVPKNFNAWLYRKIFVGIDDMLMTEEILETLKPLITGAWQTVEAKGADAAMRDVCANFIINSNHKDGLRKTLDDRRICPLFTPQQRVEHLTRDGLTEAFFIGFTEWLYKQDGSAIIAEYLHTYDIPAEFNPARGCIRAPETSSTLEAISEGRSTVEREIIEAVEQGLPGFRGGWISSVMLDRFLQQHRMSHRCNRNQRARLLENLGYIQHPNLKDGRATTLVQPDGAKPTLYIRRGAGATHLQASDAIKAYQDAQLDTSSDTALVAVK